MKETIIVIPNKSKLSTSLAYRNKNLFNVRIFTPVELAKEALVRCGKTYNKKFVSRNEELIYYKTIIESVSYFKTVKLADIKSINQTINAIRKLVLTDETKQLKDKLSAGVFKEKNDALYEVYDKYINKLNSENKIDTIGLIRYALDNTDELELQLDTLIEYPLQPLELELVKKLSNYDKPKSLYDLYEVNKKDSHIESYKNCYGTSNEVGSIIDDIYTNNDIDQCVVACADYPTYSQIFYDYACKYDIKLTFGDGISLINSYPGKLLQQYYYWMNDGKFGWEPFNKLIHCPYFNFELLNSYVNFEVEKYNDVSIFWERVSRLRLTNNVEDNRQTIIDFKKSISRGDVNDNDKLEKYVPSMEKLAEEFSLPIEDFLTKYCIKREADMYVSIDEAAKQTIVNEIKTIKNIGLDLSNDIIETLLRKPVYRQANMPNHIHITPIDGALSSLRNNLYVCGLSATIYPGSPKENPLLLDDDLKAFDNEVLTSKGKIKTKRDTLFNLIDLASSLDNKIYLSYAGLNVSELKNNNASSLLFELYKKENDENKTLKDFTKYVTKVDYFEPKLSKSRDVGNSYNNNDVIEFVKQISNNNKVTPISLNRYSPSALNTFFDCRKQFYYQYILGIPYFDEYNPYEIISVTEQGTLVHALMEYLPDHPMDKNAFISFGSDVFDEYMKISVPLVKENIENVKKQFLDMLANGWQFDADNKRKIAFKEKDKTTTHDESGVVIHGYPDRVELTKDGKAVIIDFKTERKIDAHRKDDVDSCLQVLIYAYIVEKEMNLQIDHCEYRMLRYPKGIITCKYDQEIKDKLAIKLIEFRDAIANSDFHIDELTEKEEKDKCKYCRYGSICGKVVTKDE